MESTEFAALRGRRMRELDRDLGPVVKEALRLFAAGDPNWFDDIVEGASVLWLEVFEAETPRADAEKYLPAFQEALRESLGETSPQDEPSDGQVRRVTTWTATFALNAGTQSGIAARGGRFKRWLTMQDPNVREIHRGLDGQVVPIGETFDVAGHKLRFPGEPVGPPEVWIECRCVIQPAARVGELNVSPTTFAIADPVEDVELAEPELSEDELEDDELEEGEEEITEIPVHGVLAPEGVPTGDGRAFGIGSLSTRQLPIPLRLEILSSHGGNQTSEVVTIGRVDEAWRDDADDMWKFRGAIVLTKEHSASAIEGLIDGTVRGVSIDADEMEVDAEVSLAAMELAGEGQLPVTTFSKARVAGLTIVPIPAFQEAYVGLGRDFPEDMTEEEEIAAAAALQDCGCSALTAAAEEGLPSVTVMLVPAADDPIVGASSDQAHMTMVYMGEGDLIGPDTAQEMMMQVQAYAEAASGPITAPVVDRGELGDEGADVAFVEASESLVAFRNGLLAEGTPIRAGYDLVEQFPEWTPHVTLGYPETPANAEYEAGGTVTFDRIGIWVGDTHLDYELGTGRFIEPADEEGDDALVAAASFAPGTKDGPGWITHPVATSRIRRYWVRGKGAAKIRWGLPGDFNRCRRQLAKYVQNPDWLAGLCANMHKEALGVWPGQERGNHSAIVASAAAPMMTLTASAERKRTVYPAESFANPNLPAVTPMTIVGNRIFGHLAEWGVCHIGIAGLCQEVPQSYSGYREFRKGTVATTDGIQPVGTLTYGIGHAQPRLRAAAATAHYDRPDAVRAFVNVGEDAFGIWYSGELAPWVTDQDVDAMLAIGSLSGDWRKVGGNFELIAAVAVNTPGYPLVSIAASAGEQITLIAAGAIPIPHDPKETIVAGGTYMDPEAVAAVARVAVAEYRHQEAVAARVGPARETLRKSTLALARRTLNGD